MTIHTLLVLYMIATVPVLGGMAIAIRILSQAFNDLWAENRKQIALNNVILHIIRQRGWE